MKDVIIVGGGCAGLSAALYAARAGKSVLLFEAENFGGQITAAPQVDNYPGLPGVSGLDLADAILAQVTELGVEVELDRVTSIRSVDGKKIVTCEGGTYESEAVILATGAKHKKLGLPREEVLTGRGISYCATCDGAFFRNRPVAMVGGGNTAITEALFLANFCESVTVIHRRAAFRAEANLLLRAEKTGNIRFITDTVVEELIGEKRLESIRIRNRVTGEESALPIAGLFVAIGHEPQNTGLCEGLDLDTDGYILAGEDCRTNLPGILAAGDCRLKEVRQLTTAVGDGANAAMSAWAE